MPQRCCRVQKTFIYWLLCAKKCWNLFHIEMLSFYISRRNSCVLWILDCPDSFWSVRTVSEFFRKFLDYLDNYLDSLDNFLVIWIVLSLCWDRYELKGGNIYIIAKTFRMLAKTFRTAIIIWDQMDTFEFFTNSWQ